MKYTNPLLLCLLALGATSLSADTGTAPSSRKTMKMQDATTHDVLSQKLRMAQQNDPIRDLGPAKGNLEVDPAKKSAGRDLIKSSTILSFNGLLTLVPIKSVLFIPDELKDRIGEKPNIKVKNFQEFLAVNRGWIRTIEVSREQALGHIPFNESILKSISESKSVVIATYKSGPISVLPEKAAEEVPSRLEMKSVIYRK